MQKNSPRAAAISKAQYARLSASRKDARDKADTLTLAERFLAFHRCKLCQHLTIDGYVCYSCGGDDGD